MDRHLKCGRERDGFLAVGSFRDRSSLIEIHTTRLPIKIRDGDAAQTRTIIRPMDG